MYPCVLLKVLAEYDLYSCAPVKKKTPVLPVFLYTLRGDTRPGYISGGGRVGEGGRATAGVASADLNISEQESHTRSHRNTLRFRARPVASGGSCMLFYRTMRSRFLVREEQSSRTL